MILPSMSISKAGNKDLSPSFPAALGFLVPDIHSQIRSIVKPKYRFSLSSLVRAIRRHVHTAILFTWTDYKTIFMPVVRTFFFHIMSVRLLTSLVSDCLCLCHYPFIFSFSSSARYSLDMASPPPLQRLQPSLLQDRRLPKPTMATPPLWTPH